MSAKRINKPSVRVNRDKVISFTFDGKIHQGFEGDTLASALLANGAKVIGRSYKYGRPRGIMSAGCEEPNALTQVEDGAYTTPNLKATQVELYSGLKATRTTGKDGLNVKSVLGKIGKNMMPVGFYSKTFKWPQSLWPTYENIIRGFAGFGHAPTVPDAEWYDHLNHHVDVAVVGGGLSGLLAAKASAQAGLKTILVDEQNELGGWLLSDAQTTFDGKPAHEYLATLLAELQTLDNLTLMPRTSAFALHAQNLLVAVEQVQDHLPLAARNPNLPRQRQHKIRAKQIFLATGALDRPLVFGNNDLPGVFTLGGGMTYLNRYGVLLGENVIICGSHDGIYDAAKDFAQAGANVTVADVRPNARPPVLPENVSVMTGFGIAEVRGSNQVQSVRLLNPNNGASSELPAEIVLSSGGFTPTVHLYCHDTSRPQWNETAMAFTIPDTFADSKKGIAGVGAVTGHFTWAETLAQTAQTVQAALNALGKTAEFAAPKVAAFDGNAPVLAVRLPDGKVEGTGEKAFVDYQNDVTAADIELAVRENYHSIEHVKRYTAFGFGTDQGKLTSANSFLLTAKALNVHVSQVSTTTYRPAWTPVTFGALAGDGNGATFDPERTTPIHRSHVERGAPMEVVGNWWRPWYFPKNNEDIHAAVNRECTATRSSVGIMDASTLGKIQIDGPDAREFLNRIYSNAWTKLEPGKCRYGLMLDENGMVMDDGVTACISENQFYMTTTTGGAARVLDWLELWHQAEWPELNVWMTSVTDHWSTVAVVGPNARKVLAKLCDDIDLSPEAFKFMDWRAGTVNGIPARVFRISFSGEIAYEINVEAGYGRQIWEAVMEAGAEFNITPYGTETMHVLRAEKGFIIVGQDTDGSRTPMDLGMSWAVGMKKPFPFLGKRSLTRSDTTKAGRKQLVGLLPQDPNTVLVEGAQLVAQQPEKIPQGGGTDAPIHMLGHVTSSYHSTFLGRSFALAVVEDGNNKHGQTIYAFARGKFTPVTIADTSVFVDPKGERQNV